MDLSRAALPRGEFFRQNILKESQFKKWQVFCVLQTLLIFLIGLIPPIISIWVIRQAEVRGRERLRIAIERASVSPLNFPPQLQNQSYIGDISCKFNARSPHLRCAINPDGPCDGCVHYQMRD